MSNPAPTPQRPPDDLLESWKEIATFLGKGVRTVVRWEKTEGLPVHRHLHERRSSVFAYKSEVGAWWQSRQSILEDPTQQPSEVPLPPTRSMHRLWWLGLLALLPVSGAAVWLIWPARVRPIRSPLNFEPLTSSSGSQWAPSFSPDGNHFAFAWMPEGQHNIDIYVQAIGSSTPKRLTEHPDLEFSPAWSPDGKWIAFLRRSPEMRTQLLLLPSLGGAERKLADLKVPHYMDAPQLSWSPDGKWLAFADGGAEGYGIYGLAPDTGERRQLTKARGARSDLDPAFSPDGKRLAFRRGDSNYQAEIYLQPLTADGRPAGEPRPITFRGVRTTSPVWSADGRKIFFSSGLFNSGTDNIYSLELSPNTSEAPERLTASSGEGNFSLATSWRGGLLAFTRKQADLNIWAVEKTGQGWKAPERIPLLSSTRQELDAALSPNGRQIAFVSDRSGHMEVWIAQRDGSQARKLTSFNGASVSSPHWSPDGVQITFSAFWQNAYSIWLVDAAGGPAKKMMEPAWWSSWSHDGRWIYYCTPIYHYRRIFKVPAQGGTPSLVIDTVSRTIPDPARSSSDRIADEPQGVEGGWQVDMPSESPDGAFLFFKSREGVWRLPTTGGPAELVVKANWSTQYAVCDSGVFFYGRPGNQNELLFHNFADGATTKVASNTTRYPMGLAASRDCNTVLYSQADQTLMSLMFARGLW